MDYPTILNEVTQRTGFSDVATRGAEYTRRCETDINRFLRVGDMEITATRTTDASGQATLPDDYLQLRSVIYAGYALPQVHLTSIQDGTLQGYAIRGRTLLTSVKSGTITLTYYSKIPSLVDAGSNWLSDLDSEAYVYGIMAKVYAAKSDVEKAVAADALFQSKMDSIQLADAQARFMSPTYRIDGPVV